MYLDFVGLPLRAKACQTKIQQQCGKHENWTAIRRVLLLFLASLFATGFVEQTAPSSLRTYDIPAQRLEQSLLSYAEQSGVQVISPSNILEGYQAPAVSGAYDIETALTLIIGDTPIVFEFSSNSTVFLTPAPQESNIVAPQPAPIITSITDPPSEHIIVTGTRLNNEIYRGAAPIETIRPALERMGGRYQSADMIRRSPISMASFQVNQQLAATLPGGRVSNGGSGSNGLSLRGLGNQRSLILLDGRRLSPAGIKGLLSSVDLNVIPASALERTEIIKNGSSSIYGADAIAGVVNNVTRKDYEGGSISLHGSFPTKGGGERFFSSANLGKRFDGGWASFAFEYSKDSRLSVADRDFLSCSEDLLFDPVTEQRADIRGTDNAFKCRNHNPNGAVFSEDFQLSIFQPDSAQALSHLPGDAVTRAFLPGWARLGNRQLTDDAEERETFVHLNESSAAYESADAISPMRRFGAFAAAEFYITPSTQLYANILYNHRKSELSSWMFLSQQLVANNPNNTLSEALRQVSGSDVASPVIYQLVRPFRESQSLHYASGVIGAKGVLNDNWAWDAFASYGASHGSYSQNFLYKDRLNAISLGDTHCDPSFFIDHLSPASLCESIDIPVLGERFLQNQEWTASEKSFLEGIDTGKTTYEQFVIEGTVRGDVANLPAGPMEVVLGGSFRVDSINDRPGKNALASNLHLFSTSGRTKGEERAREIFAEIGLPLITAAPLADSLALLSSVRYTNYKRSGNKVTYQAGLNWRINSSLALHGSYGTSFRGPNLFELFLADSIVFNFVDDPCIEYEDSDNPLVVANCQLSGIPEGFRPSFRDTETKFGGAINIDNGAALRPEIAHTFQIGFEYAPKNLGVTFAIDFFDIRLIDEIGVLGAQQILDACYSSTNFPNNTFCDSIVRASGGGGSSQPPFVIERITQTYTNLDSQKTRGLEFLTRVRRDIKDVALSLDIRGTYEFKDEIRRSLNDMVDVTVVRGRPNEPKFAGLIDLIVANEGWSFYYNVNFLGSSGLTEEFGGDTFQFFNGYNGATLREQLETGLTVYHTLSLTKELNDGSRLQFGVNNLFDRPPPRVSVDWRFSGLRTGTAAQNSWDLRGRQLFVSITKEL